MRLIRADIGRRLREHYTADAPMSDELADLVRKIEQQASDSECQSKKDGR
jgi:hypothetical protein